MQLSEAVTHRDILPTDYRPLSIDKKQTGSSQLPACSERPRAYGGQTKASGTVHGTPAFCYEQWRCCLAEKPSSALASGAVVFGSDETCYGRVFVQVLLPGQGTE